MIRKIITIDPERCNGCGLCVSACHEGAIALENGKAKLIRDDYCDGLGDCLPACPTNAISFEEREALPYDEAAVLARMAEKKALEPLPCGCPGTNARAFERPAPAALQPMVPGARRNAEAAQSAVSPETQLAQWPVQMKLVPVNAPYFDGAKLLIAADCAAYAYGNFHNEFMRGKVTLIGCPKLDTGSYAEKLTEILRENTIRSVTIVRMIVPCCGGLENAVTQALAECGKMIPWSVVTLTTDGRIVEI